MTTFLIEWVCATFGKLLRYLIPSDVDGARCLSSSYQNPNFSLAVFTANVSLLWQPQAVPLCTPTEGLGQGSKALFLIQDELT